MPVLALPLVVPFAEAVGITAAGLGIIELAKKVQDYMEDNPEESMKILAMIMPEQGIAALFNKEAGDEVEGEEIIDEEEKPKKLSGKEKGERIKAAIRKARAGSGNYSSPDATGPAVDIRGSVIREVEDMGIADKGLSKKPYKKSGFNYKKYFRKADGGRIGFDKGGDLSEFKIGNFRPLKYTGAIDDIWESEELGSDPLSVIVKMGLTVRAPLIDVIRNVAKTSAEAAKLIAAATKMGWDLTKPARELVGDLVGDVGAAGELVGDVGAAGLEGTKLALGQSDKWRFAQPNYWMTRAAGKMDDDEARLSMQEGKVGDFRKDKDLIKELETKLFTDKIGHGSDYQGGEVELYPGQKDKYAKGGRIGFEGGGWADDLTGQGLATYNSMVSAGHDNQTIQNTLKELGYWDGDTADTGTGVQSIVNTQPNIGGGGGGGHYPVGTMSETGAGSGLIGDFMSSTQERQNRLTNPNKVQSFINDFTGTGQADIGEMIRTGQVDTRLTSGLPLGIGAGIAKVLPDKYYDMSLGDQVFTQSQMGYTGPTVFGENTSGLNKDPFGLNVRSGFGNYGEAVGENFNSLRESLTGRLAEKYDAEFDEETGMFVGANAKLANKMTNMMRTKFNFRKNQLGAKNRLDAQIKTAERQRQEAQRIQEELAAAAAAKDKAAALAAIQKQGQQSYNPNIHGPTNYGQDSEGNQSFDFGGGFGIGSDGGPVSNRTGRGRTGYSEGGLATMFQRRR